MQTEGTRAAVALFSIRNVRMVSSLFLALLVWQPWVSSADQTGPLLAQATGGSPRYHFDQLLAVKPVGQYATVRVTWGAAYNVGGLSDCEAYMVGAAGLPTGPQSPTGVFVQVGLEQRGTIQGLVPGDQVDISGYIDWANCASPTSQSMGWIGIQPLEVVRVARVGEQAPPEPPATAASTSTGFTPSTSTQTTVAPAPLPAPRLTYNELFTKKPLGQSLVVRATWGAPYGEPQGDCTAYMVGPPGGARGPDVPTGIFVQAGPEMAGAISPLSSGDQVDITGAVEHANCASSAASRMGWIAVRPSNLFRVSLAGEPAPPEPPPASALAAAPTSPASTGPTVGSPATSAEEEPRGYDAVIHLQDGNTLRGRVIDESIDAVTVLISGSRLEVARSDITSIEKARSMTSDRDRKPAPAPKPKLTAEEKQFREDEAKAAVKMIVGGSMLGLSVAFLPAGTVYFIGGLDYEANYSTSLPYPYRTAIQSGQWPGAVAGFWGAGFPLMIVGIKLLDEGRIEMEGLHPAVAQRRQRSRGFSAPWAVWDDQSITIGWSGTF